MTSRYMRALPIVALLLLIAASAQAQQLSGTFDQLPVLVKPGDTRTITDGTGQRLRGTVAIASVATSEEAGIVAVAALLYAGIGAGIGAEIDALIEGRRVVYAGSTSRRTTLNVSPILGRERKGVIVSCG